jgi:TPR repeat protein
MKYLPRIIRTVLTCATVSAALMSAHAWAALTAQQVDDLQTKAIAGDKTALETLTSQAQQGDAHAQFDLGVLYYRGQGVPQDYGQAAQWYRKAAQQGDAYAQSDLGAFYANGYGVPQDYGQAAQWFRKAADQGDAFAQANLGRLYETGRGVPQDYKQAVQWYRKAAAQGEAGAQNNLGLLYAHGRGVPQNKVVAYALVNLSAVRDASNSNHASNNRSSFAADMTEQEIKAGQALSQEMSCSDNLLQTLDQYLATSGAGSH